MKLEDVENGDLIHVGDEDYTKEQMEAAEEVVAKWDSVSEFAPLKLKLTSQFGTQKADKFSRKLLRTFLLFELLSEAQNCLLSLRVFSCFSNASMRSNSVIAILRSVILLVIFGVHLHVSVVHVSLILFFDAVKSPEVKGYTADKAQIDKQTVNGDSKDLAFTVTYTKNAPTTTTATEHVS
ncbi:hypothetical protein ABMB44_15500 [Levilactobacillus brevis]